MPRCEGRPKDGGTITACPGRVNNSSVKNCQGDLMLCKDCENFRFPTVTPTPVVKSTTTVDNSSATPTSASAEALSSSDQAAAAQPTSTDKIIVVNELLFFVLNKFDTCPKADIQSVVSNFYRDDEIVTAKQLLIQNTQNVNVSLHDSIQPYTRKRIGEGRTERSVEDIMNIITIVDEHDSRNLLPVFCASSLIRIPSMPDDMSDLAVIRCELSDLRRQFNHLLKSITVSATVPAIRHEMQLRDNTQNDIRDVSSMAATTTLAATVHELQTDSQNEAQTQDVSRNHEATNIQPDNFVTVVRQNCDKYEEVVRRKNQQKKKVIIGESTHDRNTIKGVVKKAVVCVDRLELGTTVADVESHLRACGVNVISCYQLNPSDNGRRPRSFTSMRLCVPHVHLKKVYDASLWPLGVTVRPWTFKASVGQPSLSPPQSDPVTC